MIITLTIHERRIIFQILNLIMTADLIVKQDEIDYMDDIFRRFELSVDEFDHMDNIDLDYLKKNSLPFLLNIKNMQKNYL